MKKTKLLKCPRCGHEWNYTYDPLKINAWFNNGNQKVECPACQESSFHNIVMAHL